MTHDHDGVSTLVARGDRRPAQRQASLVAILAVVVVWRLRRTH